MIGTKKNVQISEENGVGANYLITCRSGGGGV